MNKHIYSQNIDKLIAYSDLLKDKNKIRCIRLGPEIIKCFIVGADGERWYKLEELGNKIHSAVSQLNKEVLDLRKENIEIMRIDNELENIDFGS